MLSSAFTVAVLVLGDGAAADIDAAKRLYAALEFEQVVPVAQRVLADAAAPIDVRMEAYRLLGSALAVVGDPIEAEKAFRYLLRGRPDFDLDAASSPRILAVFRKVQGEERAIREQVRRLERDKLVRELELSGTPAAESVGGVPIVFDLQLRDRRGAVNSLSLHYRKRGEKAFSSLALSLTPAGRWRAEIPAEWTENEAGFALEHYLATADAEGEPLLAVGSADAPRVIDVRPGTVADAVPLYRKAWFWSVLGGAVVALGAASIVSYELLRPERVALGDHPVP